jgi:signal transduction histidine kinase
MSTIQRTASTCADPDLICVEIDRWQALRSETGRLQNACEHISWTLMALERDFSRELHVLDLALRVTSRDVTVSSYPHWRRAVINNIVGNPVPHTDAGEMSIESKTCNADWVHTVHDAGPGIGHGDLRRASHSVLQTTATRYRTAPGPLDCSKSGRATRKDRVRRPGSPCPDRLEIPRAAGST